MLTKGGEWRRERRMSKIKVLICFMVNPKTERRAETKSQKYRGERREGDREK